MKEAILKELEKVQTASRKLVGLSDAIIQQVLNEVADLSWERRADILEANQLDLERMDSADPKYDRLLLNEDRLKGILDDIKKVAKLPSPLGQALESRILSNGIELSRVAVPIGVIAVIYESRPNVTFDVFSLCLKTGNACVLKGSRDAKDSNEAIVKVIKEVLVKHDLEQVLYLAPADREALPYILTAEGLVDCAIPRGSQGLIDFVRKNASIPVIETGAGIVHTYVDASADLAKAKAIIQNAKTRRVSVCNALDCLVLHESLLANLPELVEGMDTSHSVEIYADKAAFDVLKGNYEASLLRQAKPEDFGVEWLSHKMSIKTVASLEEALAHIATYSSKHSEAIVSEDAAAIDTFLQKVDAACVYANASTAFSDGGEFGLGAEIGISTQKLHARGPMGLREMTSYKWLARGNGQIR
ncbi:MAG: glutamate-5-semialdehyde dehydrogenase [Flavobacteriaceae bacterium]|jgi:glutamate-5-semialdehyde dehydrogenase